MTHTAAQDLDAYLAHFDLQSYRPGQKEVISAVLAGEDCLCIMPTGGGKSLCYQLPAVVRDGVALVVSPLIALMKDQVDAMQERGVRATYINSSLTLDEQRTRMEGMAAEAYDLVYIAPERLRNSRFLEAVRATRVQLLAVDEAHCISEWGHDFRPDYARLGKFRQRMGFPQTIALTATATATVRDDVSHLLQLRSPKVFVTGFARPNLRFEVQSPAGEAEKAAMLHEFLRETPGAGIIYASTRKRCEEVAEAIASELKKADPPRNVGLYHAGLMPQERRQVQEAFMADRVHIIVATNAFGMGIDKSDLRFVVHYNMPGSLEAYYQEAGRAGRDGRPSRCVLLFHYADRYVQEFFIECNYPSRETVARVYNYLRQIDEDPIEITLQELKDRLDLSIGSEGVGASEQLLEKCGVLERLSTRENMAAVRIDSDLPSLVDLLPKEAKVRRRVLQALERLVGGRRYERVFFHPQALANNSGMDRDAVARALRELVKLDDFDYVPPFRGRAVHMIRRDLAFEELEIDFEELERRKAAEFDKLDRVIRYARSRRCRQLVVLDYFGDVSRKKCGCCDNCARTAGPAEAAASDETQPADGATLEAVKMVLSGVARLNGRFGKLVVAQMLCGSKSAKIERLKLRQLSTFGLLQHLQQSEVVTLIEALLNLELVQQNDVDRYRPVVTLTQRGSEVMRGRAALDEPLELPAALRDKLRRRRGSLSSAADPVAEPAPELDEVADPRLLRALRDWRRRVADESGWPAYRVVPNATLHRVASARPRSLDQLAAIKGIGPHTLASHGEQILQLVAQSQGPPREPLPEAGPTATEPGPREQTTEESIEQELSSGADAVELPPPSAEPAGAPHDVPPAARPTHYWTWHLLSQGFSLQECALIRRLDEDVILDQALRASEQGWHVEPRWLLTAEQIAALDELIGSEPTPRIRSLLDQLPGGVRYQQVQLYLRGRAAS